MGENQFTNVNKKIEQKPVISFRIRRELYYAFQDYKKNHASFDLSFYMEKMLEDLVSDVNILENDIKMHQKCIKNAKKQLKIIKKMKENTQKNEKKCKICGATKDLKEISKEESLYGCSNDWPDVWREYNKNKKVQK